MPPPVILLIALIIGYPLVQILAIRLRRAKRVRFNAAADELLLDPRLGDHDRHVVRGIVAGSRGGMRTIKIMSRLPQEAFESALGQGETSSHEVGNLPEDRRIDSLRIQSVHLEMATHLVASTIVVPFAFSAWAVGAFVAFLKGYAKPSLPSCSGLFKKASGIKSPTYAGRGR